MRFGNDMITFEEAVACKIYQTGRPAAKQGTKSKNSQWIPDVCILV